MLAALRTPAVEPHVRDVDVAGQRIDVDAGMVTALAIDPTDRALFWRMFSSDIGDLGI